VRSQESLLNAMTRLVYLDHQATTPLDPRVFDAMRPWLDGRRFGNPHSANHRAGWQAAEAIEQARAEVAALIGAMPGEILFTSGATEANNLALLGASREGGTVVVSAIEHPSVLDCLPALERRGRRPRTVPVDAEGRIRLDQLEPVAAGDLVSVMAANNEVGTIQPLAEVAELCRSCKALLHTDAVQLLSSAPLDVRAPGIDLLSLSGHKLYGPMGIGALFVRDGVRLEPQLFGGGQQKARRPGTLPVALCVGLGEACRIAREERLLDAARLYALRERLFSELRARVPDARRNGSAEHGLAGCLNVTFPGIDAEDLLLDLPELGLSTGSACATGTGGPSHVLLAMGRTPQDAHASIRFGLGRGTNEADIDLAVRFIAERLHRP
jgi:cysteine desulfurase